MPRLEEVHSPRQIKTIRNVKESQEQKLLFQQRKANRKTHSMNRVPPTEGMSSLNASVLSNENVALDSMRTMDAGMHGQELHA